MKKGLLFTIYLLIQTYNTSAISTIDVYDSLSNSMLSENNKEIIREKFLNDSTYLEIMVINIQKKLSTNDTLLVIFKGLSYTYIRDNIQSDKMVWENRELVRIYIKNSMYYGDIVINNLLYHIKHIGKGIHIIYRLNNSICMED